MFFLYFLIILILAGFTVTLRNKSPVSCYFLHYVMLVLSYSPFVLHVLSNVQIITRTDAYQSGSLDLERVILVYAIITIIVGVLLFIASLFALKKRWKVYGLLPVIFFIFYYNWPLMQLLNAIDPFITLDNMTNIWLFASSAFTTLILLFTALLTPLAFAEKQECA